MPIFIRFRDYAQSGKAIQSYLDKDYTAWLGLQPLRIVAELPDRSEQVVSVGRWLDTEWQAGRALLILDGADEEFVVERRRQALDSLRLSRDRTTIPRVLLTSRPVGLSGVSGFEKIELRELEPRQMDQLVRQCGVILGAPQQAEQFIQDIHRTEHQSAWQLAKRPGHLVQMVVTYVHDGVLLTAEEDIMERVAEQRFAITGRVTPVLTPDDPSAKRQVAEALSFHLLFCHQGQAQDRTRMLRLVRQILRESQVNGTPMYTAKASSTMLEDLCHNSGWLTRTRRGAAEVYTWESVPWLQFFAAMHLARRLKEADAQFTRWIYAKGKSSSLNCSVCATVLPPFGHYFWHGEWQETIVLLAGMLDDATALLQRIKAEPEDVVDQMANLVARCLGKARQVAPRKAEQMVNAVRRVWERSVMTYHYLDVAAMQALARGRHPQWALHGYAGLKLAIRHKDGDVRRAAVEALGRCGSPEAVAALLAALEDGDGDVRRAAAEALGRCGSPEAVAALLAALEDEDGYVRRVAAGGALGKISQRSKIRIDVNGQWHPLPHVKPASQDMTSHMQMPREVSCTHGHDMQKAQEATRSGSTQVQPMSYNNELVLLCFHHIIKALYKRIDAVRKARLVCPMVWMRKLLHVLKGS